MGESNLEADLNSALYFQYEQMDNVIHLMEEWAADPVSQQSLLDALYSAHEIVERMGEMRNISRETLDFQFVI